MGGDGAGFESHATVTTLNMADFHLTPAGGAAAAILFYHNHWELKFFIISGPT
jgi:hypothetical protein